MGRITGERRALAAAVLAMYGFLYLLIALQVPDFGAYFGGQALIYALGFIALVAGYFWARWFVIGLGLSGFMVGAMSLFQMFRDPDVEPFVLQIMIFYAATHLAITGLLWGDTMAKLFDGRQEWRQRFHLDESATNKLGKSVIRVGVSLPFVIMYAFAPREGAALAILGGGMVVAGAWALTKMRSWSVPAMALGALGMLVASTTGPTTVALKNDVAINLDLLAFGAVGFTMFAVAPFVGPMFRFLVSDK